MDTVLVFLLFALNNYLSAVLSHYCAVVQRDLTVWSNKESSNTDLRHKNISILI